MVAGCGVRACATTGGKYITVPGIKVTLIRQFPPIICSADVPRDFASAAKSSAGRTIYHSQPAGGGQEVGVNAKVTSAIGVGSPGNGVAVNSVPGRGVRFGGGKVERGVEEATDNGTASINPKPIAPITIIPVATAPNIPNRPERSVFIISD
jgi:hypothetical protein